MTKKGNCNYDLNGGNGRATSRGNAGHHAGFGGGISGGRPGFGLPEPANRTAGVALTPARPPADPSWQRRFL
jgi:hypothetical protein